MLWRDEAASNNKKFDGSVLFGLRSQCCCDLGVGKRRRAVFENFKHLRVNLGVYE